MKLKPRATYLKYSYSKPADSLHACCRTAVWRGLTKQPPCVRPGVCLWVSTDSGISPSFPTSNADASSITCCYNIASKTHSDIPFAALVSCQIGQSIPHLFYCYLIDFPPPRIALSTARTFICLLQCDFQPTMEKVGFLASLSRTEVTLQTIFLWK